MHVHITGGGGEAGPASRCPEAQLSKLISAGITTVVGVTGTDSVTRSQVCAPLHQFWGVPHLLHFRLHALQLSAIIMA